MVKCSVCIFVLAIILETNAATTKEKCSRCVTADKCQAFGNLNRQEQQGWQDRFICNEPKNPPTLYGFSGSAKGDLVCCPENIWGVEDNTAPKQNQNYQTLTSTEPDMSQRNNFGHTDPYGNSNFEYPPVSGEQSENNWGGSSANSHNDGDYYSDDVNGKRSPSWQSRRAKRPNTSQNPYFLPAGRAENSNTFSGANSGGQCNAISSLPPNPDTGCCGQEASDDDKINVPPYEQQNPRYPNPAQSRWIPPIGAPSQGGWPSWMNFGRKKRESEVNVTVDNRIAGGKETDLKQFPWTVLLTTTFTYPTKEVAFSCGGSLISSRYVLTAGHCVFDQKGQIKDVAVNLAEYDKRTFPRDCKMVLSKGEACIDNIVIHAEDVVIHPEYDDDRLYNDIALIRLRENAPYSDYIRPICLPPIDVDNPDFSNLRLAVAGWGRNGQYKSNTKQSTIVNLVPQRQCKKSYPGLTRRQVCAAGYTGEDTCKGDSGGPLMMLYGGKYYVSGVVSGKRADAPCGTSVPSLYTNVYQYVPWIRSVISN